VTSFYTFVRLDDAIYCNVSTFMLRSPCSMRVPHNAVTRKEVQRSYEMLGYFRSVESGVIDD
jgi:hypothetical protein